MCDEEKAQMVRSRKQKWEEETVARSFDKLPEKGEFATSSDSPVNRLYTPVADLDFDYLQHLGFPGESPFTRGVYPTMYRGRLWTMRQYAGFGSAELTNNRFKYLLEQGPTGLRVCFGFLTKG